MTEEEIREDERKKIAAMIKECAETPHPDDDPLRVEMMLELAEGLSKDGEELAEIGLEMMVKELLEEITTSG